MRRWKRHRRRARIAGSIIAGLLLASASASLAADWSLSPYLQVAGGNESALLVDPGGAAVLIPGGAFLDLTPTLTLQSQLAPNDFLQFGASAGLERFLNEAQRLLFAQTLWTNYVHRLGAPTRLRVSLNGLYFDDSEQSTLRRLQGGAESGVGYYQRTWSIEGFVAGQEVGYPNANSVDSAGDPVDYRETRWSIGAEGSLDPLASVQLLASVVARKTDSVLSEYNSRSMLSEMSARWEPARFWWVDAYYVVQWRLFDSRPAGFDEDEYRQWGIGVGYRVANDLELRIRWSEGNYLDTFDQDQPTDRFEIAVNLGPAIFGVDPPSQLVVTVPELTERTSGVDPRGILFQVDAPDARGVAIAGDFNAWNPAPMKLGKDGSWELWIPLDPGSYQYLYLVDGVPTVPPESTTTVADGFGGRNGIIEVLSP